MTRHKGVFLQFNFGGKMHIATKDQKESLKFEMTSSKGFSNELSGLIGYSIRPKDYHINAEEGTITVSGRVIRNVERTWIDHSYCYLLKGVDVYHFLGQQLDDFEVVGAELIEDANDPK